MLLLRQTLWRLNLPAMLAILTMIVFSSLRFLLTVISWPQLDHSSSQLASVFLRGLLFDGVVSTYVYGVFAVLGVLVPEKWRKSAWGHKATLVIASSYLFALGFVVVAEWFFWQEFNARFNFIAVDYLVYRREVTGNISESYPVVPILSTVAFIAMVFTYLLRHHIQDSINHPLNIKHRTVSLATAILMMVGVGQLSGNDVPQLSDNMYVEELAHNGAFQFFFMPSVIMS